MKKNTTYYQKYLASYKDLSKIQYLKKKNVNIETWIYHKMTLYIMAPFA